MASVNKAIIVGNVGGDPEIRYTAGGDTVASFSVATSESWTDKSGEKKEQTEWHRCVAYRKTADFVSEYVQKGSQLFIEAKLRYRKYTDKNGIEKQSTELEIDRLQLLGSRPAEGKAAAPGKPAAKPARPAPRQPLDEDTDIPF